MSTTALTWFEIPVSKLDRAQAFYETVLAKPLQREAMGPVTLAVFPYQRPGVGGCLQAGPGVPAATREGTVVYLDASPSLDEAIERARSAGAQVLTPRTALPPGMGFFAHVLDSEGNRVGLHALE